MAVSPQYAHSLVGQWVDCHSVHGIHSGILHEVRPDGIVLARHGGTSFGYAKGQKEVGAEHADQGADVQHENVFFSPFFFIPFFLLFALNRRRRFFI